MAEKAISAAALSLGYPSLRDKQKESIVSFLQGKDVFVSLPTGCGKSLCYYVLPVVFDLIRKNPEPKCMAIIISPLIALMKDQVASLADKGIKSIRVCGDFGENDSEDGDLQDKLNEGEYQCLFFSPEALLCNDEWRDMLQTEVYQENVIALVVDEAHLVQKWGQSFRQEYANIGEISSILPSVNVMALTATATTSTRKVICQSLGMKSPVIVSQSPNKPNIFYKVNSTVCDIEEAFTPLVKDIRCKRVAMERTVIFCRSYNSCTQIYHYFRSQLGKHITEPRGYLNFPELRLVDMFTACTHSNVKDVILKQFRKPDSCLRVIVATLAFGMGLDCPNVRFIVHWGLPSDIESYMQETGRAGRDENASSVELFSSVKDCIMFTNESMKSYANLPMEQCRRNYLLSHFGMGSGATKNVGCKCCDNCSSICVCESCCPNEDV